MPRAKNKKRSKSRTYGLSMANEDEQSEEFDYQEEGDSEDIHQVPAELASYALTAAKDIPDHIRKYWRHRTSLFSYFDGSSPSGMLPLLDEQSWFSVTPEAIAARISHRCRSNVILDAFCGAGGNAIQFAFTCNHVIAIDIDPVKLLLARHNAKVYGVQDRITFLLGDWREFVENWMATRAGKPLEKDKSDRWSGCETWAIDVVFLSPPWGGIDYRQPVESGDSIPQSASVGAAAKDSSFEYYSLSRLEPGGGQELYNLATRITPNVCMYLPRTVDLTELASVVTEQGRGEQDDFLHIEEQWLGNRCKAIACYFGNLIASGTLDGQQQED